MPNSSYSTTLDTLTPGGGLPHSHHPHNPHNPHGNMNSMNVNMNNGSNHYFSAETSGTSTNMKNALRGVEFIAQHIKNADKDNEVGQRSITLIAIFWIQMNI